MSTYKYTGLGDLQDDVFGKANVYGIVRFIAHSKNLKMMLLDEAEIPIYCELEQQNGGEWPTELANDTIIRVHRCRVRTTSNQQKVIFGKIGVAGLHIAAWHIDRADYKIAFKSSKDCTVQPNIDHKRIDELRKFWKSRVQDDSQARIAFFAMLNKNIGPLPQPLQHQVEEDVEEDQLEENEEEEEQQENQSECSFDEFANPRNGQGIAIDEHPINEEFLENVKNTLMRWKKNNTKKFAELSFHTRPFGEFFDTQCKVLSVLVPREQSPPNPNLPVYLRVCDGTQVSSGTYGLMISEKHNVQAQSDLFSGKVDYEQQQCRPFVHHVSCFDEFAKEAKTLKAGDIVELQNVHAKVNNVQDYSSKGHLFSIRGIIAQCRNYQNVRGIKLLERPADEAAENAADQQELAISSNEIGEPANKKIKQEDFERASGSKEIADISNH